MIGATVVMIAIYIGNGIFPLGSLMRKLLSKYMDEKLEGILRNSVFLKVYEEIYVFGEKYLSFCYWCNICDGEKDIFVLKKGRPQIIPYISSSNDR